MDTATEKFSWTLAEVSAATGIGKRRLEDDCRAKKYAHVKVGDVLTMTREQIEAMLAHYTVSPPVATVVEPDPADIDRQRVLNERRRRKDAA